MGEAQRKAERLQDQLSSLKSSEYMQTQELQQLQTLLKQKEELTKDLEIQIEKLKAESKVENM